jgi:hypothetical protein
MVITRSSASYALSAISKSACISRSRWSAPNGSWAWPPLRTKATGLPNASTKAWILVLNPPQDLPMAWSAPAFFGRLHFADERARWYCRSSRIHCRRQPPSRQKPAPRRHFLPNGYAFCEYSAGHQSVQANPATQCQHGNDTARHQQIACCPSPSRQRHRLFPVKGAKSAPIGHSAVRNAPSISLSNAEQL